MLNVSDMQRLAGESEKYLLAEAPALRFSLTPCQGLKDISGEVQFETYFCSFGHHFCLTLYFPS